MAKKKRKVPGLNASSTADISFILLIFFLITTSMDTDMGLARRLPQPPEDEEIKQELKIKDSSRTRTICLSCPRSTPSTSHCWVCAT